MEKEITFEDLQSFEANFNESKVNRVAMNAVTQAGVLDAAKNYAVQQNNPYTFSIEVEGSDEESRSR